MAKDRILDISDLRGMTILDSSSGARVGEVTDAIIHPTGGRLLGIALKTADGERRVLATQEIRIGEDAVMTAPGAHARPADDVDAVREGVSASEGIIGANVVTDAGKLIGRISEVHISMDHPRTVYRVTESTLQKWFGGGFYIAGNVPRGYAGDKPRLIVPADVEERLAANSVIEALDSKGGSQA
jgi:sporulation protein YlmC with PRC-barrel domain